MSEFDNLLPGYGRLVAAPDGYAVDVAAMRGVLERPGGLHYHPDVLSRDEEAALLGTLTGLDFVSVVMHGQTARRTVHHFGFSYDFDSWELRTTEPVPDWLAAVRRKAARLADREPELFAQGLVTHYPPGASIGWHRDATAFGSVVVGISLRSAAVMRFQRRAAGGERRVFELRLEPRSAYVLSGAARSAWQHSIPAVKDTRYSVTFRTLRDG